MITKKLLSTAFASLLLLGVGASSASALQTRIYVASTGLDTDDGSVLKPKKTFANALTNLAAGGEIVVLDTANYGAATITHGATITTEPGVIAYVTVPGTNSGLTVAAGSSDTVTIRGLNITGGNRSNNSTGGSGINVTSVGSLRVENCNFTNFYTALYVSGTTSSAVVVDGGSAFLVANGIQAFSSSSSTALRMTVSNFRIDGATNSAVFAFAASSSGSATSIMLDRCVVANNLIALAVTGAGANIHVGDCTLSGNSTTTSITNGGIYSFGNNKVAFNTTGPEFSAEPLQ